jgi:hypothetical protein
MADWFDGWVSDAKALQGTLKPSEQTATLPGANDGGSNISAGAAETLPQTRSERDILRTMEQAAASSTDGSVKPVTGGSFTDAVRGLREGNADQMGTWLKGVPNNVGLGDLSKKVTEGADAMVKKFSEFPPFAKLAAAAPSWMHLGGPKDIKKMGPGALTAEQKNALLNKDLGAASAKQVNAEVEAEREDRSYMVTLTDAEGFSVEFNILPEIVENRSVAYEEVQPPQFPGAFQKYKGTASTQWSVNAIFVCRTTNEATINLMYVNRLRGWTMPFFGERIAESANFRDRLGAPPPVLTLHGLRTNMIGPVPVVITSLNWNWPRDVDYIPAYKITDAGVSASGVDLTGFPQVHSGADDSATVPFPAVISIAIQLVESRSIAEFNGFNLAAFRVGDFENAFVALPAGSTTTEEMAGPPAPQPHQEAQGLAPVPPAMSEPPTAMDGEGGRLPISPTATEGNSVDLSLG